MSGIAGVFSSRQQGNPGAAVSILLEAIGAAPERHQETIESSFATVGLVANSATPPVQILRSQSGRLILVFFGEDFSGELAALHGERRDFEQIWSNDSQAFLRRFNGVFAGVVIDREAHRATLFNDRFGLGRVYIVEQAGELHFSTAARSLLAAISTCRTLLPQSVAEYLSVGCVLQNRTLYRDIQLLPSGSAWTFHAGGRIEKLCYFDRREWEEQEPLTESAYAAELQERFSAIVPRYLKGPPAALSLTGGLDSRMVLAWAKPPANSLPCYTFGGPYRDCADVRIARELAQCTDQSHRVLKFGDDFFRDFASLAEETIRVSDGTMDVSGAVELYMNRLAREIAPVRLTGNYGSEILRANVAFRPRKLDRSLYTPEFDVLLGVAADTYRLESQGHRLSFIAFKQVPWHHYSRYSVERSVLTPRSPFLDNDLVALAYRVPRNLETSPVPLLNLIAEGCRMLGSMPSDRAHRNGGTRPMDRIKHQWHEFTAKAEYAFDYGMPTWLVHADRIVSQLALERLFLGRHKFYHFRTWYHGKLARFLRELPLAGNSLGCYRDGAVAAMVESHTRRRANRTLELHRVASLSLIDTLTRP